MREVLLPTPCTREMNLNCNSVQHSPSKKSIYNVSFITYFIRKVNIPLWIVYAQLTYQAICDTYMDAMLKLTSSPIYNYKVATATHAGQCPNAHFKVGEAWHMRAVAIF